MSTSPFLQLQVHLSVLKRRHSLPHPTPPFYLNCAPLLTPNYDRVESGTKKKKKKHECWREDVVWKAWSLYSSLERCKFAIGTPLWRPTLLCQFVNAGSRLAGWRRNHFVLFRVTLLSDPSLHGCSEWFYEVLKVSVECLFFMKWRLINTEIEKLL